MIRLPQRILFFSAAASELLRTCSGTLAAGIWGIESSSAPLSPYEPKPIGRLTKHREAGDWYSTLEAKSFSRCHYCSRCGTSAWPARFNAYQLSALTFAGFLILAPVSVDNTPGVWWARCSLLATGWYRLGSLQACSSALFTPTT